MARIYKEPSNDFNDEHIGIINKMLELQDILLDNPPSDKKFNMNSCLYLIDFIDILSDVKYKDYSDTNIYNRINSLHNKVFKKRRI